MGLTLGEGTLYFGSGEKLDKFESIQVQKRSRMTEIGYTD